MGLRQEFQKRIRPDLAKQLKIDNVLGAPVLTKIVINMGVGEAAQNAKEMDAAQEQLGIIAGQKPLLCRAKKSISNFKLRKGQPIACKVTMRGPRMYEFFERMVSFALPRIRDFRGVPISGFDGRGNYTLGLKEQSVFPEIDYGKIDKIRGMDITFVTTADDDESARTLLAAMGMPFARTSQDQAVRTK